MLGARTSQERRCDLSLPLSGATQCQLLLTGGVNFKQLTFLHRQGLVLLLSEQSFWGEILQHYVKTPLPVSLMALVEASLDVAYLKSSSSSQLPRGDFFLPLLLRREVGKRIVFCSFIHLFVHSPGDPPIPIFSDGSFIWIFELPQVWPEEAPAGSCVPSISGHSFPG